MTAVDRNNGRNAAERRQSSEGGVRSSQETAADRLVKKLMEDENLLERVMNSIAPSAPTPARPREQMVLDARAPLDIARRFVDELYRSDTGARLLHARNKDFFCWDGSHYVPLSDADARADLYEFLEKAVQLTKEGRVPFRPSQRVVNGILDAVQAAAHIPSQTVSPAWLDGRATPPVQELVVCKNGILHLSTRPELHPHDPALFSRCALPFAYDKSAPSPKEWLRFLDSLWPEDPGAVQTLQEVLGYLVSGGTRHQKIFLLVGPKRSGKGTIGFVIRELLGAANVAGPTLSSLTGPFGLEPLENRSLAVISDARLSGRSDQAVITERLLAISGEDILTVDRKNRTAWTGKLPTRFLILTNELPRLTDGSGALASRFLMLTMTRSFLGQEDLALKERLRTELPGIFRWALEGWDRLQKRGHFIQPASSEDAVRDLEDLGSPVATFLRECCTVEAGAETPTDVLYQEWRAWCSLQGHDRISTAQVFGRDLRAVVPSLATADRRSGSQRWRVYVGIRLESGGTR